MNLTEEQIFGNSVGSGKTLISDAQMKFEVYKQTGIRLPLLSEILEIEDEGLRSFLGSSINDK
jgi:hypothetical protein